MDELIVTSQHIITSDEMPDEDESFYGFEFEGNGIRWNILFISETAIGFVRIRSEVELFVGDDRVRFTRASMPIEGNTFSDITKKVVAEMDILFSLSMKKIETAIKKRLNGDD
jgi:hypothetical protein